jgi:hypothetical protein
MDTDIYALVGKYGFKALHSRLSEIMREEFQYLQTQFQNVPQVLPTAPLAPAPPAAVKKAKKQKVKAPVNTVAPAPVKNEPEVLAQPDATEIKDIIVTAPLERGGFRDPKEMKAYQKDAEEAKRKENDAAGIQLFQILTKDNLKQWVEVEGRTYAWVAREKAGCAETQVAATAQMMGIKSKISKKRGIIMAGK